jgi:hypothetical protein
MVEPSTRIFIIQRIVFVDQDHKVSRACDRG